MDVDSNKNVISICVHFLSVKINIHEEISILGTFFVI